MMMMMMMTHHIACKFCYIFNGSFRPVYNYLFIIGLFLIIRVVNKKTNFMLIVLVKRSSNHNFSFALRSKIEF
jgi:hypothetical protein